MKVFLKKIKSLPAWAFLALIAAILIAILVVGILAWKLVFVPILALITTIGGRAIGDVTPVPDPAVERLAEAEKNRIEAEKNMRLRALRRGADRRDKERRDQERRDRESASKATDEDLVKRAVEDAKGILKEKE